MTPLVRTSLTTALGEADGGALSDAGAVPAGSTSHSSGRGSGNAQNPGQRSFWTCALDGAAVASCGGGATTNGPIDMHDVTGSDALMISVYLDDGTHFEPR